jgi:hypothetical protein
MFAIGTMSWKSYIPKYGIPLPGEDLKKWNGENLGKNKKTLF